MDNLVGRYKPIDIEKLGCWRAPSDQLQYRKLFRIYLGFCDEKDKVVVENSDRFCPINDTYSIPLGYFLSSDE